ncbi:MAG: hypothetical protein L3K19_02260 [Thermoplasmata archaeon]|nr:hypothetical protein [Thermoplasmata archaeon]
MDHFHHIPPAVGGTERSTASIAPALLLTVLVGLLILGSLTIPTHTASPRGSSASLRSVHADAAPAPAIRPHFGPLAGTHGDLIVGPSNSPFYIKPTTAGSSVYVEQGNISVLAGGTLVISNETIVFSQFISNSGTVAQRLGHLYWCSVKGTLDVWNSTVTTDARILNAYPRLNFNVSSAGTATLVHSSFQFPGYVNVYGSGSSLLLNASNITRNFAILNAPENLSLLHDSISAPATTVSGGAHLSMWASSILNYFRDNTTRWGMPGAAPVYSNGAHSVSSGGGSTWNTWTTPTDSENLTRAVADPTIAGADLAFSYSTPYDQKTTGANSLTFGGTYALGQVDFTGRNYAVVALPQGAVNAINAAGITGYLNASGAFGGPSTISLTISATNGSAAISIFNVSILVTPVLDYNLTVAGAGSSITAVDSTLDLNWNLTPGSSVSSGIPIPWAWGSQKLLLNGGATAYLANLSVTTPKVGVFWNASAVLPDPTSTAYLYRWIDFPVTGAGGSALAGAQLAAFYSYDSNQLNNATATTLNNLATADPSLNAYLSSWLAARHLASYGVTDAQGVGSLLLASGVLTQATLPDGTFLGGYHVAVTLAGGGPNSTKWISAATTPYPAQMTPASADQAATTAYPAYRPELSLGALTFSVGGAPVAPASVRIGDSLEISGVVKNIGSGPVASYDANLSYIVGAKFPRSPVAPNQTFPALTAGSSRFVNFTWTVSESIVGQRGTVQAQVVLEVLWNGGGGPIGGVSEAIINVTVEPSLVHLTLTAPTGNYQSGTDIPVNGTVEFSGKGFAIINVSAITSSGRSYLIGQFTSVPGPYNGFIALDAGMPSGTYSINVTAYYNTVTGYSVYPAAFTVGSTSSSPSTGLLDQKFLGVPLLYWIIIAIGVAAVLAVLFLYVIPRQARGKLVECGECGSLIPETATQCPKCGAEFETDLVRCSRCGSTIPSNSTVCPECAAQLLGKPDEGAKDPERQGYADFVERFRAESKKELGDNYSEGAFWDWWKRQGSYTSFSQWKLQQSAGSRVGMGAPVVSESAPQPEADTQGSSPAVGTPPKRGGGSGGSSGTAAPAAASTRPPAKPTPPSGSPPPAQTGAPSRATGRSSAPPAATTPSTAPAAAASGGAPMVVEGGMKPCQTCGKEIPPDYLVCPFCGAVTR